MFMSVGKDPLKLLVDQLLGKTPEVLAVLTARDSSSAPSVFTER